MRKHSHDLGEEIGGETVVAPVPRISLSAEDAALSIGVSKRQLYAMKDAGEIPYIEVGPQTFVFDPQDLADWLRRKKKTKGA